MGPRRGAPGRTDTRGCGIRKQTAWTNQDRAAAGRSELSQAAVVFKRQTVLDEQFAVRKCIGLCLENTVVSFLVYEHPGNTEEVHLYLHRSRCEAVLCQHTFSRGCYSHCCSLGFNCMFPPGHACLHNIALRAEVSAVSSAILSLGRSTRNPSRNREKEIQGMSAAVCLGVLGILF